MLMNMKTKFLTLVLLSCFVISVSAQEYKPQIGFSTETGLKTNFKKNKFGDNWFISLAGAGTMFFGDDNNDADFKDRVTVVPQLSIGKWFNPYFALRIQGTGGALHGYENRGGASLFLQHNYFAGGHLDFMLDLTNYWAPYRESKVFRFIPWIGLGYSQRWSKDEQNIPRTESPTLNTGILTAFRLGKHVDFNIEVQGVLLNEDYNRIYKRKLSDGIVQVSAGLTFKLGKTDFEVIEPMDYALLNDLNGQVNDLRAQNAELSKRPKSCPDCPEVVPAKVVNNYAENVVYFRINSSRIDKNQQINIFNTSEFVKENNIPIKVVGYADKNTGTSSYNMGLSEKRAKAVAKELIEKYGINSNQISIEWRGSDEQPYTENNWNRVVIMTAESK
jgi:outer membrane protein OmpA-like peptidoglycan-associated protein